MAQAPAPTVYVLVPTMYQPAAAAPSPSAPMAPPRHPPPPPPDASELAPTLDDFTAPEVERLPEEVQAEVEAVRRRLRAGRQQGVWLRGAIVGVAVLAAASWAIHYGATVLSYAQLDSDIQLRRETDDPERLILVYRPTCTGMIGFSRVGAERETEVLDHVLSDAVGKKQQFQWRISGLKTGEVIKVTGMGFLRLATSELAVPDPSAPPRLGDGILVGDVVNGVSHQPIGGATVRVAGTKLTGRTDVQGRFRIEGAPTGPQRADVSANGFSTEGVKCVLDTSADHPIHATLNPGIEKGPVRIVLHWEKESKDLDAHLEGPLRDKTRFYVYYHQQGDLKGGEFARLESDVRDGRGPETITMLGVVPGTYRYYVHDYSNRDDPKSTSLSRSGAVVEVQHGGQTYRFQPVLGSQANIWDVCTIEVTPEGATVHRVDQYRGVKFSNLGLYEKGPQDDGGK